ncbi:helix-turn-helix transcriptional regulator [Streptomyces sp. NPDC001985]|uniref:helix-turn-helix transcriptional regulator n=1 Tax=Streptomyces sp. NPDC001985 TaxID=3154406 RepID=UPI00332D7211
MLEQPSAFGSELRRARLAAGLSLTQLASLVHYSKAQLSKVETGRKRPTEELARLCDARLRTGGRLLEFLPDRAAGSVEPPRRRSLVTAGAATVLAMAPLAGRDHPPGAEDGTLLEVSRALFDQFRRLGQTAPPAAVLPALAEQTRALRTLSARSGPRTGKGLLALSAHYAEFAGWMAQEAGAEETALSWTDQAVELAAACGDSQLASYSLVRRGLMAYYAGDGAETIALARAAQSGRASARVRGLAAQREAQGHALLGHYSACMHNLDRAREFLDRDARESDGPTLGTTNLIDPVSMTTGWSLLDLGRPREAAQALGRELSRVAEAALRTRARYGTRQALAHALAGEIDQACALITDLLGTAYTVSSATIALDLRRLARALARHRTHPAVRELSPLLAFALAPATPSQ